MIDKSNQNTALYVCLEDVGTHNKAVLDFFFAKLGQHKFCLVDSQDEANVLIIDYDYPPARQRYEDEYQQWHKPTIVLSISPVELEEVIWLAKPLTSRALLDAADEVQGVLANPIQSEALDDTIEASSQSSVLEKHKQEKAVFKTVAPLLRPEIKPVVDTPVNIPLVSEASEDVVEAEASEEIKQSNPSSQSSDHSEQVKEFTAPLVLTNEEQEERWVQLCGTAADIDAKSSFSDIQAEDGFFLSSLKDAVRLARQCQQGVLLNFPQVRIYVLPEIHRVFCSTPIDEPEFKEFIDGCSATDGGKMHILSTREIHELNDMIAGQTSALYDLEAFVWTSSLLSAHGLLSRELDPTKVVGLKHWPSLTRLERFPHVMPIAALWSAQSQSAFDVARSLNVPQRYVFSFCNAANALGLIEQDPDKLINKQSASRSTEAPRGLFSRLLKRLIGG